MVRKVEGVLCVKWLFSIEDGLRCLRFVRMDGVRVVVFGVVAMMIAVGCGLCKSSCRNGRNGGFSCGRMGSNEWVDVSNRDVVKVRIAIVLWEDKVAFVKVRGFSEGWQW